jgi:hypothetical protein
MRYVETIPEMEEGGIKWNSKGGNSIILIYGAFGIL